MVSIAIDRNDGLSSATAIKGPVKVATTANIALTGLQTIDGLELATGDRVLVKDQATATENGIYVVDAGPWRRAKDFSGNRDVKTGTQVYVTHGTLYAATGWYVSTVSDPIVIGGGAIGFQQNAYLNAAQLNALKAAAEAAAIVAEAWAEGHEPGGTGTRSAKEWSMLYGDLPAAVADATVQAGYAADSAVLSDAKAIVAMQNAIEAVAARDAAFVNADVFADVGAGRAAVADGEQFIVVSGADLVRYRRDSSSTQTEVARLPSSAKIGKLWVVGTALDMAGGSNITLDLATANGDVFGIAGTTSTIASFGSLAAGQERELVFSVAATILHNSPAILCPGSIDLVVQPGDIVRVRSVAPNNWRITNYEPYDGRSWALRTVNRIATPILGAATVDLSDAVGDYLAVTGSGAVITSFGTPPAGRDFELVFSGANTIVNDDTSLICPQGKNITTAMNDVARVRSNGAGLRVVSYLPYAGSTLDTRKKADDALISSYLRERKINDFPINGLIADPSIDLSGRMTNNRPGTMQRINALGVYETTGVNAAPNWFDSMTGEYLGYRLEQGSTNNVLHSEDLSNVYWTLLNAIIEGSATASALGLTLQRIEETAATGLHGVSRGALASTNGTSQIWSAIVLAAEVSKVALMFDTGGFSAARFAKFDLTTGTLISKDADIVVADLFEVAPGVWRIWAKAVPTATTSTMRVAVLCLDGSGATSYAGTIGDGFYAGALNLETAGQLTDYIPTAGSAVTRFTNNITTDSYPSMPEGTAYVEFTPFQLALVTRRIASIYSDASNRIHMTLVAASSTTMRLDFAMLFSGTVRTVTGPLLNVGQKYRIAVAWKAGRQVLCVDGGCYDLGVHLSNSPVGAMKFAIGSELPGSSSQAPIYLNASMLFRRALENWELSSLTSDVGDLDSVALRPIMGAVTDTSARFMADFASPRGDVQVIVSNSPKFTSIITATTAVATEAKSGPGDVVFNQVDITATGLIWNSRYYAAFKTGNRISAPMQFRTAPADAAVGSMDICVLSCNEMQGGDTNPAFLSVAGMKKDLIVHLGDWAYFNPSTDDVAQFRQSFIRRLRSSPNAITMLRSAPVAMMVSNHDVTASDTADVNTIYGSGKTYPEVVAAGLTAYKESFPHYPLTVTETFAQTITRGRVRILMVDTISKANHTSGSALGSAQMTALKTALTTAGTDGMKLVILTSQNALNGGDLASWDMYYETDLVDLLDYIRDTAGVPACLFYVGNNHQNAASDGTELSAATTGGYGNIPYLMSSGLISNGYHDVAVATWNGNEGTLPPRDSQWAVLHIDDKGGSDLTWRNDFYCDPYDPITHAPTLQWSVSSTDAAVKVQMIDATQSAAASGALSIDVEKTWFGPVDGCTVEWTAPGCSPASGTLTFRPNQNKATITTTAPGSSGSIDVTLSNPTRAALGGAAVCSVTVS